MDPTSRVEEVVRTCGTKNGLAHIFAPSATEILIVTEHETKPEQKTLEDFSKS